MEKNFEAKYAEALKSYEEAKHAYYVRDEEIKEKAIAEGRFWVDYDPWVMGNVKIPKQTKEEAAEMHLLARREVQEEVRVKMYRKVEALAKKAARKAKKANKK